MKLKIKKQQKNILELQKQVQELTTALAIMVHRDKGEVTITDQELKDLPRVVFAISPIDNGVEIKLNYL